MLVKREKTPHFQTAARKSKGSHGGSPLGAREERLETRVG
jgi:hypothetical protein